MKSSTDISCPLCVAGSPHICEEADLDELRQIKEKYKDALEVLRQIDKLPTISSYHLEKFKEKYREEF